MTENTRWQTPEFNWLHRPTVNGLLNSIGIDERLDALKHALKLHPDDGFLNGHYGRACQQSEQFEKAVRHLSKAIETQSADVSLPYSLGLSYRRMGDDRSALPWLQKAVAMGANADHIMALIHTACDTDNFEAAIEACKTGLENHPSDQRILCIYPQILVLSGQPDAALAWLDENDSGSINEHAKLKYEIYIELNRSENAKLAQLDYQRRLIRSQDSYRTEALAVIDSLPSNAAKIELIQLWQKSIQNLVDCEEPDIPIRLAMSILVRDEVDIIEHNIRYHAAMGVSHFVVTDNGSKDGTRELLEKLSSEFSLTLIDEPSHTIDQDLWVTRMAETIKTEGGYDWIIHNDADEFWCPDNGESLPTAINDALRLAGEYKHQVGVLSCPRVNMMGSIEATESAGFRFYHNTHEVLKDVPIADGEKQWNDGATNTVARLIPDKVMTRTEGLNTVGYGNHGAEHELQTQNCHSVTIYHFPVRTFEQFEKKVKNYGESLEKNTRFNKNASVHLRYWYKRYLEGKLLEDYQAIAFSKSRLAELKQQKYLEHTSAIESFYNKKAA